MDYVIRNVIYKDHSYYTDEGGSAHRQGNSYFRTSTIRYITDIVNEIINTATRYRINITPITRQKLIIEKTFTIADVERILERPDRNSVHYDHYNHIGRTGETGLLTNNARLVFDVTDMKNVTDYQRGSFSTGYPY